MSRSPAIAPDEVTTTRIGDPTGRSTTRPVLTPAEIDANARAFLDQVTLVLRDDPEVLEVRRNSEWYDAGWPSRTCWASSAWSR